jgi:hypothetical protein
MSGCMRSWLGHVTLRSVAVWLATASVSACTLAYDADRKQCTAHSDCLALGVAQGVCSDGLCQTSMQQTPDLTKDATNDASVGSSVDGSVSSVPFSADAAPHDATASSLPDVSQDGDGSSVPLQDAEPGGPAADAGARAEAGPGCVGAGCAECSIDADCVQRGMPGATCADGICWAPASQCTLDTDCRKLGPEYVDGRCVAAQCRPNPRWRCERPAPAATTETKKLTILVRHSLSLAPLVGIRAQVCQKLDLQCMTPLDTVTTQADGILTLNVPANFSGYLKVDDAQYFPALYFLPAALPADGVLQPFPLLSAGLIIDALAFTLGTGIDARRGHMMLISEDCMGMALPGVTFKSPQQDTRTVQFYVRDQLPSTSAEQTAEIGNGGYLNFPAGTAVIELKQVATGMKLNTVSVVVRAGYISVAYIRPELR